MLSQDDRGLGLAPLDSVGTSLNRLERHLGLVALESHQVVDPFDYLFLNREDRGIKSASKASPTYPCPNQVATP